jgi:hypothetical protein
MASAALRTAFVSTVRSADTDVLTLAVFILLPLNFHLMRIL